MVEGGKGVQLPQRHDGAGDDRRQEDDDRGTQHRADEGASRSLLAAAAAAAAATATAAVALVVGWLMGEHSNWPGDKCQNDASLGRWNKFLVKLNLL